MRATDSISLTIRFPIEIYQFLRKKADEEFRTFNSLVVHLLAIGIEHQYGNQKKEAKHGVHDIPESSMDK